MTDDVKVTVLPYIPPERKSFAEENEQARLNHEEHQRYLDSLMFKPSKPASDPEIRELKELQHQIITQSMPNGQVYKNFHYPIDKGKVKG